MNYEWPANTKRGRGLHSSRPPGLWKCHAASVALQMATPLERIK